jgi:hypothetical protein
MSGESVGQGAELNVRDQFKVRDNFRTSIHAFPCCIANEDSRDEITYVDRDYANVGLNHLWIRSNSYFYDRFIKPVSSLKAANSLIS